MEYRALPHGGDRAVFRRIMSFQAALPQDTVLLAIRPFSGGKTESHALLQSIAVQLAENADLTLAYDVHGKPYFPRLPQLCFNISHSGNLWACAFSQNPLGLDLQQHSQHSWKAMSNRYFHPLEMQYVQQNGEKAFFDVWSAKESYLKYLGCGLSMPMQRFSVVDEAGHFPAVKDACLTIFPDFLDYSLLLCTEKQPENIFRL